MAQAETGGEADRRPLSPHLTIYKPMLSMAMSMAHRISGAALYLGAALLAIYLLGLAFGVNAFATVSWLGQGFFGYVVFGCLVWALYNHLLGGVRHAFWDRGLLMDPKGRELLVSGTLAGGIVLTVLTFAAAAIFG
jgi:succinate dehydrogenase / fumarate reductase cytochrome b subunit